MELRHGDRRPVGPEAVENGVPEGRIPGEAADDVPRLRQDGDEQRVDAVLHDGVGGDPGHHGERRGRDRKRQPPVPAHARPTSCAGRATSTSTRSPKLMMSVYVGSR